MNKEYAICRRCPINQECHPALIPEILSDNGLRSIPISKYEDESVWHCRSFTCLQDGMGGAKEAKQHGRFGWKTVVELSGKKRWVRAAVFGSPTKRTDVRELRVVTRANRIYSRGSDGVYYRAGSYVAPIKI